MATISTTEYLLDQAKRRFTPSINNFPGMGALEQQAAAHRFPQTVLAEPPPGSGLKPVMGDAGLPVLGHMVEMFRGGPEYLMHLYKTKGPVFYADSPVAARRDGAGTRRRAGHLLQPQQGLLAAGLDARSSGRSSTAA